MFRSSRSPNVSEHKISNCGLLLFCPVDAARCHSLQMASVSDRDLIEVELGNPDGARDKAARREIMDRLWARHESMEAAFVKRAREAKAAQEERKDHSKIPLPPRTNYYVNELPKILKQRIEGWERETAEQKAAIPPETWDPEEVRVVPRVMARERAKNRQLDDRRRKVVRIGWCLAIAGAGYVVYKVLRLSVDHATNQRYRHRWQGRPSKAASSPAGASWSWPWFGSGRRAPSTKAEHWWSPLL